MAFARASAMRSAFRAARFTRAAFSKAQPLQGFGSRGYAAGGTNSVKPSSELPWLALSVGVTVAGSAYLLSGEKPSSEHGHHDKSHGKAHGEADGEKHEEHEEGQEEPEDASKDDTASEKSDDGSEDKPKEEDSAAEPKDNAKEEQKTDESDSEDDGAKDTNTPAASDDENEGAGKNTVKHIPDAKGGFKKRLESNAGTKQGKAEDTVDSGNKDKAAASKEPAGGNSMSSKQEGLSNTDTKHSTDIIYNGRGISKKGEGIPETAKTKGTVDPNRPQDNS